MEETITTTELKNLLIDADKFNASRAITLGKLALSILDYMKITVKVGNFYHTNLVSGTGLEKAIDVALSSIEKKVVDLHFFQFNTYAETSFLLNIPTEEILNVNNSIMEKLINYQNLFYTSIDACELSLRARACLERANIPSLQKFSSLPFNNQNIIRNMGFVLLTEVRDKCISFGLPPYKED